MEKASARFPNGTGGSRGTTVEAGSQSAAGAKEFGNRWRDPPPRGTFPVSKWRSPSMSVPTGRVRILNHAPPDVAGR
jgi:hypothetical protein